MRIGYLSAPLMLTICSCQVTDSSKDQQGNTEALGQSQSGAHTSAVADSLVSHDASAGEAASASDIADPVARPLMGFVRPMWHGLQVADTDPA